MPDCLTENIGNEQLVRRSLIDMKVTARGERLR
jgi:hypothetical protein